MSKILLFLITFATLLDSRESYETNLVARKLLNPINTLEADVGFLRTINRDQENDFYLNMRYSLTKKVEVTPIGFNYLFYNSEESEHLTGFRYIGTSSSSTHGTSHGFEINYKGKYRTPNPIFALYHSVLLTLIDNESGSTGRIYEMDLEPIYAINDYFFLELNTKFVSLDDKIYSKIEQIQLGSSLYYTLNRYIDFGLHYSYYENAFVKNLGEPLFNFYKFDYTNKNGQRASISIKIRFFL